MTDQIKDIAIRAAMTFVEAFLGTFAVGISTLDLTSWDAAKAGLAGLAIGAASAAASAVWNYLRHRLASGDDTE